jgi:TPR repeat protein
MNEIVGLNGQPFHQPRVRHPRRGLISFKRVGGALLRIFGSLALVGLVCWLGYGTLLIAMRAQAGEAQAQYRLGKRQLGLAVSPQDRAQALKWIRSAAEQGHVDAQTALGILYAKGNGSPPDSELAASWFRKAAMQGDSLAQNELATMYATGRGVGRNLRKAAHWYARAAAGGSQIAQVNLALAEAAKSGSLGNLTTRNGHYYSKVALRTIEPDGIMIAYDSGKGGMGLVRLKRDDLPDNLRQLCKYASRTNSPGSVVWF